MSKVLKIEEINYSDNVYNLHVKDNHNYFANGLCVSNCHLASGDSLTSLLNESSNCLYKLGLTGTMPKQKEKRFSLVSTLGKTATIIKPQGLIDRGLATPVTIVTIYLNYMQEDRKKVKKMNYQEEVKFLEQHINRNLLISKIVIQATKLYGNSIMMYSSLAHGEFLLKNILKIKFDIDDVIVLEKVTIQRLKKLDLSSEQLDKLFVLTDLTPKDIKVLLKFFSEDEIKKIRALSDYHIYLIKGSIEGETRNLIRKILESVDDAILIGSDKTVSTGMNIKRIHNIFRTSSTKSSILLNQTIGRGMRLHKLKNMMRLFDIIDDFSEIAKNGKQKNKNQVLKHSEERLNEYIEHGYPIIEKELTVNPD